MRIEFWRHIACLIESLSISADVHCINRQVLLLLFQTTEIVASCGRVSFSIRKRRKIEDKVR